jgi:hypothetical protein
MDQQQHGQAFETFDNCIVDMFQNRLILNGSQPLDNVRPMLQLLS